MESNSKTSSRFYLRRIDQEIPGGFNTRMVAHTWCSEGMAKSCQLFSKHPNPQHFRSSPEITEDILRGK